MGDIKRHFRIDAENDEKIMANVKTKKSNYTKEINIALKKGFSTDDVIKLLNTMIKQIQDCQFKLYESIMLSRQLYSDMEFPERTNPKSNKLLQDFDKDLKRDKFHD